MVVNTQSYIISGMILSERVQERMTAIGLSQSELARRVGVAQPTIYKLLRSSKKGSTKLHLIARELGTTPAYLAGEIDDPDENAPAPGPRPIYQHILMPVALPSEQALAEMFAGLLAAIGPQRSEDALAHELAQLLPTALSQLRGRLIETPPALSVPTGAGVEQPPTVAAGSRR